MHLDALLTLGYDAHYFGYTLDKLTHRVNLSAFTLPLGGRLYLFTLHFSLLLITSYLKKPPPCG